MLGYKIKIEGQSPGIVMNNPESMNIQKTKVPTPEKEAEMNCYRFDGKGKHKGELYVPSNWFWAAVLKTASNIYKFKIGGKTQYVKGWIAGCTSFLPEKIPLGIKNYEIYITSAVVPVGKRVSRARPRIFPWSAEFQIEFTGDDEFYCELAQAIMASDFEDCLRMSGIKTGIGDNRPSAPKKPGPHGRYKLIDFQLIGI